MLLLLFVVIIQNGKTIERYSLFPHLGNPLHFLFYFYINFCDVYLCVGFSFSLSLTSPRAIYLSIHLIIFLTLRISPVITIDISRNYSSCLFVFLFFFFFPRIFHSFLLLLSSRHFHLRSNKKNHHYYYCRKCL